MWLTQDVREDFGGASQSQSQPQEKLLDSSVGGGGGSEGFSLQWVSFFLLRLRFEFRQRMSWGYAGDGIKGRLP